MLVYFYFIVTNVMTKRNKHQQHFNSIDLFSFNWYSENYANDT